jgi:uncharacterized protein DUF4199
VKRTVLTFGVISGLVSAALMLLTARLMESIGYNKGELLGYAGIVMAALVVFFGIRSYRQNAGGGRLSFGRGLAVGVLITLVASLFYVATFQLLYFKLMPGYGDTIVACMIDRERAKGASPKRLEAVARQGQTFKRIWDNPLTNAAFTFIEPFPVGVVIAAVSAAILRKR